MNTSDVFDLVRSKVTPLALHRAPERRKLGLATTSAEVTTSLATQRVQDKKRGYADQGSILTQWLRESSGEYKRNKYQ